MGLTMTDRYAVIGNPIEHSKSPDIHTMFAEQTSQDMEYAKHLVALDGFKKAVSSFFEYGGKGLNVTVPFKEEAFRFADALTPRAKIAEAVNTLAVQPDGKVLGDNTDGAGLVSDICERQKWPIKNKRVLLLGAGGAAKGVVLPLLNEFPAALTIANRTESKAISLLEKLDSDCELNACTFDGINGLSFDLVINATSASLSGNIPPIPDSVLDKTTAYYDMMYGKELTVFLSWAKSLGATKLSDGLGMLVGQAAESFYLWRGERVNCDVVIENLRNR